MTDLYVAFAARNQGLPCFGWKVITTDFVIRGGEELEDLSAKIEEIFKYDALSVVILNFQRMEFTVEDQKPFTVAHIDPPRAAPTAGQVRSGPMLTAAGESVRSAVFTDANIPDKPPVDMLRLCATIARLLAELTSEVRRCTPSHTWDRMTEIYEQTQQLRRELEELTK